MIFQWAFYGGQDDGWFEDIDYITMFADYRVPQVLVYFGAMQYDDHLMKLLQEGIVVDICFESASEICLKLCMNLQIRFWKMDLLRYNIYD